jgi:hypothetical protein
MKGENEMSVTIVMKPPSKIGELMFSDGTIVYPNDDGNFAVDSVHYTSLKAAGWTEVS